MYYTSEVSNNQVFSRALKQERKEEKVDLYEHKHYMYIMARHVYLCSSARHIYL